MSTVVRADEAGLARAVARLRVGELVAFPTETVYGLGAAARDPAAVRRIFACKGRPADHPVIVHVREVAELEAWIAPLPNAGRKLARAFWPGPLTIVGLAAADVSEVVTGGQPTVAVRCPAHPVAAALLERFGGALAAPSANRFGRLSPTRPEHVADEFPEQNLLILDGGASEVGLESTIVDVTGRQPRLLRPGSVTTADLAAVLGVPVEIADRDAGVPRAPGRLASHYAPGAPVHLVTLERLTDALRSGDAALLRTAPNPPPGIRWIRLPADPDGYARGLYAALRTLDETDPGAIVVEAPPEHAAWMAIHDRLERAAAPRRDERTEPNEEGNEP